MIPIALGTAGLASVAHAWAPLEVDGQAVRWAPEAWPLPLATVRRSDRTAAAAWTATGPACFQPEGPTGIGVDGHVAVADLDQGRWAEVVGDAGLVAFTLITHADGQITDADVVLNAERYPLSTDEDPRRFLRETVVAHELGHVLGLGHPCGEPGRPPCDGERAETLMAPRLAPGLVQSPGPDEAAGLAAVAGCDTPDWAATPVAAWAEGGWLVTGVDDAAQAGAWAADGAWAPAQRESGALRLSASAVAFEAWTAGGRGLVGALPDSPETKNEDAGGCVAAPGRPAGPGPWVALAALAGVLRRGAHHRTRERV